MVDFFLSDRGHTGRFGPRSYIHPCDYIFQRLGDRLEFRPSRHRGVDACAPGGGGPWTQVEGPHNQRGGGLGLIDPSLCPTAPTVTTGTAEPFRVLRIKEASTEHAPPTLKLLFQLGGDHAVAIKEACRGPLATLRAFPRPSRHDHQRMTLGLTPTVQSGAPPFSNVPSIPDRHLRPRRSRTTQACQGWAASP